MKKHNTREIRIDGERAYVPLTKGHEAIIDVRDLYLVEDKNWCALAQGHTTYAVRADYSTGKYKLVYMHRHLQSAPDGLEVDHIDGNGLNNSRSNLRVVSRAQNAKNLGAYNNNTSGFKGASFHKASGKWQAQIRDKGAIEYLGLFETASDAHEAYVDAAKRIHKEFYRDQ